MFIMPWPDRNQAHELPNIGRALYPLSYGNELSFTRLTHNSLEPEKPVAVGFRRQNWNLEVLVFVEGGKSEDPERPVFSPLHFLLPSVTKALVTKAMLMSLKLTSLKLMSLKSYESKGV